MQKNLNQDEFSPLPLSDLLVPSPASSPSCCCHCVWCLGFQPVHRQMCENHNKQAGPPHSSRVPFYRRHRTFSAVKVWPHCHTAISGKGEVGFVMRVVSLCCFCCLRSSVQFGKRTQLFLIGSMIPQYLYSIRYFPKKKKINLTFIFTL